MVTTEMTADLSLERKTATTEASPEASPWAVAAFFISTLSCGIWLFGHIPAPAFAAFGVLFGIVGLRAIKQSCGALEGQGMAWIGVGLGSIHLIVTLFYFAHPIVALMATVLLLGMILWRSSIMLALGLFLMVFLLGLTVIGLTSNGTPFS